LAAQQSGVASTRIGLLESFHFQFLKGHQQEIFGLGFFHGSTLQGGALNHGFFFAGPPPSLLGV
jgi:hypothetical protein